MSHASLKEQLQAVASRLSTEKTEKAENKVSKKVKAKAGKKPKWLESAHYGVELLKTHFPCSFKNNGEIRPLKVGIKQDLVKMLSTIENIVTEDKACMVKSLSYYVNTSLYLKAVVEGASRVDLDGKAAGQVTAEEAKYSKERQEAKLKKRQSASIRQEESTGLK